MGYLDIKPPKAEEIYTDFYPRKPNRPYSYYAATNFHPLDLSKLANNLSLTEEMTATEAEQVKEIPVLKWSNKKTHVSQLEMSSKRLSTSLGDLQILSCQSVKNVMEQSNGKNKSNSQSHLANQVSFAILKNFLKDAMCYPLSKEVVEIYI